MRLQRAEFLVGDAINAVKGSVLDADVLADHLSRHASLAQSECQRVRHGQFAQRGFALAEVVGHPVSMQPCGRSGLSTAVLNIVVADGVTYLGAAQHRFRTKASI